jgi:hypothetical protein
LHILILVCAAIGTASAEVAAQTRSMLTGVIRDDTGAVMPGVTVTLTSPSRVGGPKAAVTNAEGAYRLPDLSPGSYALTAELSGFQTVKRTGLEVPFAATLTVDLVLQIANVAETVIVTGAGPVVDVKSAAAAPTMTKELLENLPLATDQRLVVNLLELTPGMYGRSVFGSTRDTNNLTVDGVPLTHPQRGSIQGLYGINRNWLQEMQVVALGASAEYGEFTGSTTNFAFRSGGNLFTGLVDYWATVPGWVGDNRGNLTQTVRDRLRPAQVQKNWDITPQIGGPIKQDRLFFFVGADYSERRLLPFGGAIAFDDRWLRVITKMNWAVAPSVRVEGFVVPDLRRNSGGSGFSPLTVDRQPETGASYRKPQAIWGERLTWAIGNATLLEVRNSGLHYDERSEPTPPNSRSGPAPRQDQITRIFSANLPTYSDFLSGRDFIGASVTRYLDRSLGKSHELKFGTEFEQITNQQETGFPGGRSFQDIAGAPSLVTLWNGNVVEGTGRRTSLYAQDRWTLTDKLVVEPGVRATVNRGSVPDKGAVFRTTPVSSRIGAAFDVTGSHKTVLRAHYGRFHDALVTGSFEFMNTSGQAPRITARVVGPDDFLELNRFSPQGNLRIDPDLKQGRVDQYLFGVEHELGPGFSVQAQYIKRDFRDTAAFIDTQSRYESVQRPDPGPDGVRNTVDDGTPLTVFNLLNPGQASLLLTNPPEAFRRYNGLQLVLQKRYAETWQVLSSYTVSKTEGTVNTTQGESAAIGPDTGQSGVFANPNRAINRLGASETDFTHQLKVEGLYRAPLWGGVDVSSVFLLVSGAPFGRTVVVTGLTQGSETLRVEPRGTRRTDALKQIDLRFAKTIPLGARSRAMGIYAEIFNLANQGMPVIRLTDSVFDNSGANFGLPRNWIDARTFQAGLKLMF